MGQTKVLKKSSSGPVIKRIILDLQTELYTRFQDSIFRRESNTDAEGVRACIKKALSNQDNKSVPDSQ